MYLLCPHLFVVLKPQLSFFFAYDTVDGPKSDCTTDVSAVKLDQSFQIGFKLLVLMYLLSSLH
jgi:hypothetical protein